MIDSVADFETFSSCLLGPAGAMRYASHWSTEVLSFTFEVGDQALVWYPNCSQDITDALMGLALNPNIRFVAHNAIFDRSIWREQMVKFFGFPDIPDERWHDTQAVCAMKALPLKLERAALVLGLPAKKDKEGSRITIGLSKPNKKGYYEIMPEKLERVYDYNRSDISTTKALHRRIGELSPAERNVWLLDQRINQRGVRLDMQFVRAASTVVQRSLAPLAKRFAELTGGLEISQVKKITEWVRHEGCAIPGLGKEIVAEILGSAGLDEQDEDLSGEAPIDQAAELPDHVREALIIRQTAGSASIKKLISMSACVGDDGRARGVLQYHGAAPGLWSGRLFQPQNFPRGTLSKVSPEQVVEAILTEDPEHVEATLGRPAIECVVSGLRHAIIASPGCQLLAGDFAGIQARLVLAVAGQHDKTELMAAGADVYCDMATSIYKTPVIKDEADKVMVEYRQTGKNSVLGLGFQMGPFKFQMKYAKNRPFEFCEGVVRTYRKEWAPKVPPVWYALQAASTKTVWEGTPHEAYGIEYRLEDGWLTARLPSGRKIWYYDPQKAVKAMPWDKDDVRPCFTYRAMKMGQWRLIYSFGGQCTENVIMGMQRDLLVRAMFRCEAEGLPLVLNVHDELITEPLTAAAQKDTLTQIMTDRPPWAEEIMVPLQIGAWVGERYKKG